MSSSSNKGLLFWVGKAKFADFFFLRSINLSAEKITSVKSDLLQKETFYKTYHHVISIDLDWSLIQPLHITLIRKQL